MSFTSAPADKAAASFFADELERLMAFPLETLDDVARWDDECARVQTELETRFPSFTFEEQVDHFFTDSDIRQRDAGYRQWQHQAISDYVTRLRH
jgi:hypothetical protein